MQDHPPHNRPLRGGRFTVGPVYKKGGQALVYKGYDLERNQQVVIKQTSSDQTWAHQALQQEAELLARLSHPSLPQVIDNFVEQENYYLVMQYVPGADLSELLKEADGPLPLRRVLDWAEQLLDILEYLQEQNA